MVPSPLWARGIPDCAALIVVQYRLRTTHIVPISGLRRASMPADRALGRYPLE